jgi:hypothetical protein
MIHAAAESDCVSHAEALSRLANISDYQTLFSLKEFKKSSIQYFFPPCGFLTFKLRLNADVVIGH